MKENRGRILACNKGANDAQVDKISAAEWAALDPKDKKQYEDKNAEDRKRSKREMEAQTQNTKRHQPKEIERASSFT
jgi:hypothetical protein